MRYTPETITELKPNEIFVFGSNGKGIHGKGAAKLAIQFGAIYGQAQGRQGQTYAIITKNDWRIMRSSTLPEIQDGLIVFMSYAKQHSNLIFLVVKLGCSLGGYTVNEIANLFINLDIPDNVVLPKEFWNVINQEKSKMKTQVNEPIGIIKPVEVKTVKPELKEIPSMTYAGIGSRQTPNITELAMIGLAMYLQSIGFKLYSGAADGADKAFSDGCTNKVEFIPWKGFNNCSTGIVAVSNKAMELAATLHPAWDKLSQGAKKLMARNCHQILGEDLQSPVDFVLCWTPDGAETKTGYITGGTGQAIRLANRYRIPVINMFNNDWKQRLDVLLEDIHILNKANQINLAIY